MARAEKLITPKGTMKYCHLNRPDVKGAERFGGEPKYKVTLVFAKDTPKAKAFMKKITELQQASLANAQEQFDEANAKMKQAWKKKKITEPTLNDCFSEEVDENGNETGNIEMRFSTHSSFKDRDTGKKREKIVPFIDGRGEMIPVKKRPLVFSGTVGSIAFSTSNVFIPKDAEAYLGLYLNSVQISKLVSSGGGDNPFEADEDSDFSADDLDEYEGNAAGGDDDDADDSDSDDDLDDDLDDDEIPF